MEAFLIRTITLLITQSNYIIICHPEVENRHNQNPVEGSLNMHVTQILERTEKAHRRMKTAHGKLEERGALLYSAGKLASTLTYGNLGI